VALGQPASGVAPSIPESVGVEFEEPAQPVNAKSSATIPPNVVEMVFVRRFDMGFSLQGATGAKDADDGRFHSTLQLRRVKCGSDSAQTAPPVRR
jgi:hypothetical protein